jgi:nitrate/nitrite transporter NarK
VITQVFVVTSLLGVLGQMPISRWVERDIGTANGMWLGMATMGSAYLWLALDTGTTWPFVMCAIQFSLGSMLVFPLLGAHIPNYAPQRELAAHYGLYSCIGGVFAFVGNALVGVAFDSAVNHWLIWLILSGLGICSGAGLWWQVRREQQRTMVSEC